VVLGGLLVGIAAVIVFSAVVAGTRPRGRPYVVAAQSLPAGTVIGPGDITVESMTLPLPTRRLAFGAEEDLIGHTLAVAVDPGELVESPMLVRPGASEGLRPVSVPVATDSMAGLRAGTPVDLLSVPQNSGNSSPGAVSVVLRGATLLSVAGPATSGSSTVVTLGVSTLAEAESAVQAAETGTVVLIEAEPGDGTGPGPPPG